MVISFRTPSGIRTLDPLIRNFHSNPSLALEVPGGFEPPYTVLQTAD